MSKPILGLPADYASWLTSLKQRIQGARQRALLSANSEQIRLYHDLGRDILERQSREKWGAKVIEHLSADLRAAFPDMQGLSVRNLKYMKFFAEHCPDRQFGQQSAAQIAALPIGQQSAAQLSPSPQTSQLPADQLPWFHIVTLLTKLSDPALRYWYAREALQQSWPRDTLTIHSNFDWMQKQLSTPKTPPSSDLTSSPVDVSKIQIPHFEHNIQPQHLTQPQQPQGTGFRGSATCVFFAPVIH